MICCCPRHPRPLLIILGAAVAFPPSLLPLKRHPRPRAPPRKEKRLSKQGHPNRWDIRGTQLSAYRGADGDAESTRRRRRGDERDEG